MLKGEFLKLNVKILSLQLSCGPLTQPMFHMLKCNLKYDVRLDLLSVLQRQKQHNGSQMLLNTLSVCKFIKHMRSASINNH